MRPFDVVVLGMGPDAHTASWFPGAPQLAACLDPEGRATVLGLDAVDAPVAGAYRLRMTLTLPAIVEAQQTIVLIFGQDKKQVLGASLAKPVLGAPIRGVLEAASGRCVVFWAD